MNQSIEIKIVNEIDIGSLCIFLSEFPEDKSTLSEWAIRLEGWWDKNPACDENHIRGVVLIVQDQIVGFTGNIPSRMIWNRKEIIVVSGTTWRVLSEFRKYSMDLWLKHKELNSDFVYFNTTPSDRVIKLLNILKYDRFNVCNDWYYYFGYPKTLSQNPALRLLAYGQRIITRLIIASSLLSRTSIHLEAYSKEIHDNQLDEFWENSKGLFSFTNVRDSKYVEWIALSRRVWLVYKKRALIGFVVLKIDAKKHTAVLTDYWGPEVEINFLSILKLLISENKRLNVVIPDYHENIMSAAKRLLLIRRGKPNKGFIYSGKEKPLDPDTSFLTLLQGDYGF